MDELGIGRPARGTATGRPILVVLDALGRRGALRLLWELGDGAPRSFRMLVAACESNPGSLNTRLRELRGLNLIALGPEGYALTEHGRDLAEILIALNGWADAWAAADGSD